MIYVILERGDTKDSGWRERNGNIEAQAKLAQSKSLYGEIVSNSRQVKQAIKRNDKTLYLFAHGNNWVVGRFDDMDDLVKVLRDELKVFESYSGKSLQFIIVNSCESDTHAGQIAALLKWVVIPNRSFTVIGTKGRAFTDNNGNIRVAKSDKGANELDKAITNKMNQNRFYSLIEQECHRAGEGLARYQCP